MVIEKMYSKISSQQADSDRIFAELEKKRMKLEHELLKMQQVKRVKGPKGRGVKTEFQLKMVSKMHGQHHHLNSVMFSGDQYCASSGYSGGSEYEYYSDGENRTDGQCLKPL